MSDYKYDRDVARCRECLIRSALPLSGTEHVTLYLKTEELQELHLELLFN